MVRLGPYQIEAELGAGGMGTVYAARLVEPKGDLAPGDRVALKVIHPHLAGRPSFVRRFLREAAVGRRIRAPNVVATLDAGQARVDGRTQLYIAFAFVEGRTLRRMLQDLGTVPEGLLRELARQIARGLEAIHAQGVVHRDLKPENLLVDASQQVCIMDLGVARLAGSDDALTATGHFAGSVHYAAPEQFRQEEPRPAADLYALGVVLYEMATGRNPFRRDDVAATVHAHLEEVQPPVHACAEGFSPFLSEVVATLLAKDPAQRFASAAALADVLDEGERSAWWSAREKELLGRRAVLPDVPVRRSTALFGRDRELALLEARWEDAVAGRGNVVLVEGEAGIGKTRFVDAFLRHRAGDDAHLFYGAYLPTIGLGAFSDALVERYGEATLDVALEPYLGGSPQLLAGFSALVRHAALPAGARRLEGDVPHALMVRLVRSLAGEKPVLWVVEDLHFAPPESRALLASLARGILGRRVLLLVTTRPTLPDEEAARLTALPHASRLALERLSPRAVVQLLREAFGSVALADRLGARIAYKSDGVPFFVFEMVRGLEEGGFLARKDDGSYVETRLVEEIEVPSAVRDLVQARLGELDRHDRAILDVGAVEGFEFDPDLAARVLERKPMEVLQALAEVERRSALVRGRGRVVRFDHHQVRDVLYESVPEGLRTAYHQALAAARADREGVGDLPPDAVPHETCVFLVAHHLRGACPEEALPYLERALDHLGASYRTEAVIDLIERALAAPGLVAGERQVELLLREAKACGHLGRREAQERALDAARALLAEHATPALRATVLTDFGWFLVRVARYADAETDLRAAREVARAASLVTHERRAAQQLGVALLYQGRLEEGEHYLEEALALARAEGSASGEAAALGSLGNALRARGKFDEALANHRRHRDIARRLGDVGAEVTALGNLGNVRTYQHAYAAARGCYTRALDLARSIGDRFQEATLLGNLAGSYHTQGNYEKALEVYERALAMSREIANRQGEAHALLNIGHLHCLFGDAAGAVAATETARDLSVRIGDPRLVAYARLRSAEAAFLEGDGDRARALAEGVLGIDENAARGLASAALGVRARVALRRGDREAAARDLEAACARALPDDPARDLLALHLAVLRGEDAEAIARRADALARTPRLLDRIEADEVAWAATGEDRFRARALQNLRKVIARVPEAYRTSLVQNVPPHQAVWTASA